MFSKKCKSLTNDEVRVKLRNIQLNKLKYSTKSNTGTTLRTNNKNI